MIGQEPRLLLRATANAVNGTTPLGLVIGWIGGARLRRGPRGLWIATGYRRPFPVADAFTIGNVITTRHDDGWLADRPALLKHEERHAGQYAVLGAPLFFAAYLLGVVWSLLRARDPGTANPFERAAGLADGGYCVHR